LTTKLFANRLIAIMTCLKGGNQRPKLTHQLSCHSLKLMVRDCLFMGQIPT
jgi:hypothetical protein